MLNSTPDLKDSQKIRKSVAKDSQKIRISLHGIRKRFAKGFASHCTGFAKDSQKDSHLIARGFAKGFAKRFAKRFAKSTHDKKHLAGFYLRNCCLVIILVQTSVAVGLLYSPSKPCTSKYLLFTVLLHEDSFPCVTFLFTTVQSSLPTHTRHCCDFLGMGFYFLPS